MRRFLLVSFFDVSDVESCWSILHRRPAD